MSRIVSLSCILSLACITLLSADDARPVEWPGAKVGGGVLLPNGWSLKPVGRQTALGDFPVNIAVHPSGKYLAILHAGYGDHEIIVIDAKSAKKHCRVIIDQTFYGLTFSPDGKRLYASGAEFELVHSYAFADGLLSDHQSIAIKKVSDKFMPAGLVVDAKGEKLYTAGLLGHQLAEVSLTNPQQKRFLDLGPECFPYGVILSPNQKQLYVSKWGQSEVAIIDTESFTLTGTLATADHPTEMAITPDGKRLFTAYANSTLVTVHDLETKKTLETLSAALYPSPKVGNTPNSVTMTPDGQLLFVANADANNLAVFNIAKKNETRSLGFIPVGWYPTSVRYNPSDKKLYVANGKGGQSFANPQGPMPLKEYNPRNPTQQYIGGLMRGSLSTLDLPTPVRMGDYSKAAFSCSPQQGEAVNQPVTNNPIPAKVGDPSPIKYCIYVIKENRTYDQVFGDMAPR
ncbi:MAG TPA: YncE family protein, partial [Gemmatales bacterium]|nr:YncE family protein [Gemmatales bacterium]